MLKQIFLAVEVFSFLKRTKGKIFSAATKDGKIYNVKMQSSPRIPRLKYSAWDNNRKREVSLSVADLAMMRCGGNRSQWARSYAATR